MIYLYPNLSTPERVAAALRVVAHFESKLGMSVRMAAENSLCLFGNEAYAGEADSASMIVSVGGDGTVLRASKIAVQAGLPLLGINSGRLGFLCALEVSELPSLSAEKLQAMPVEERTMLSIRFNGQTRLALNDVVIARSRLAGTLSAAVTRGSEQLLKFRGDGMIVSTPTGSTAYSRSAGGPVLTPDSGCFSLTPICAHTPGTAPIVVPDRDTYMVSITDTGRDSADVLADGVPLGSLSEPLSIRRHDRSLRLLRRKED